MLYGTVCCLGDSLTAGARALLGYPELLPDLMRDTEARTEWATRNFGVSGETTRQILDRTPGVVGWLASQAGARRLVLLAGTNDSKAGGSQTISVDQWESLYRQILHWPRRHGIPSVVCTFPPLEANTREMPFFTDRSRAWLEEASTRVRKLQEELNCEPVPVTLCEMADMPPSHLADGVHLKPSGYAWMAARIATLLGYPAKVQAVPERRKPRRRVVRASGVQTLAEF